MSKLRTYVSLFSSAGVGCFGFKSNGFECVATNELLDKRMKIQKLNNKCKYDSGYVAGDISTKETQEKILNEISYWEKNENLEKLDVLVATPPCQGMSTANYKKSNEINRNSLVVEAIHLVKNIEPRIFIYENVRSFLTTMCIDKDEEQLLIKECIYKHLEEKYNIFHKVVNFMDYGIPSSRPRTLVIGTLKTESNISPLNIFPLKKEQITVKTAIGDLPSLKYGERDSQDIYHSFRTYPQYMQEWIHELREGDTAFNNEPNKVPYKIVHGNKQVLKSAHMGNKFCRMYWDKPAPCITTRNDQLASQSTIHPIDDRVLSIRELMRVMSIPDDFKWVEKETAEMIDKNETLIRQSIGEAVPTGIMSQIAANVKEMLDYDEFIENYDIIKNKQMYLSSKNYYIKSFIFEKDLSDAKETGSFYTPQVVVYHTIKDYKPSKSKIKVLEPSVGLGAFIPQFLRLVDDCESVEFYLIDISNEAIDLLNIMISDKKYHPKFKFNFVCDDFIKHNFPGKYDAIISNPPYFKTSANQRKEYKDNTEVLSKNIYNLFLEKYSKLADEIMCVIPKNFLMIPDSNEIRQIYQDNYRVKSIYDYGVNYFKNVFIEIISIDFTKNYSNTKTTHIENMKDKSIRNVDYDYIYHDTMWLLYRDEWFDNYIKTIRLNVFDFYRDRQLTNKYLKKEKSKIWVVRSKNLNDDGIIKHIEGYDRYVDSLEGFVLEKFYGKENIIFTNFTYNTRATMLPKNYTVNGSFCILIPKEKNIALDLNLYSSRDFRRYYAIVKNNSKFTINVDSNSIYYIGVKNNDK